MKTVEIKAEPREDLGTAHSRRLRRAGHVPCVLNGAGDAIHFFTDPLSLRDIVYTADFKVAQMELNGKTYRAILKDIQFDPVTEQILHVDFQALLEGRKIKVEIPVHFEGSPVGVKNGGVFVRKQHKVLVKTTPDNLVAELLVDVAELGIGESVRVKDIKCPNEIEILTNPSIPIASITRPRVLVVAADDEEEEEGTEESAEAQTAEATE